MSSSKSFNSNKMVETSSQSGPINETISFVYKIVFVDETHLHAGRHYLLLSSLDSAEKTFPDLFGNQ